MAGVAAVGLQYALQCVLLAAHKGIDGLFTTNSGGECGLLLLTQRFCGKLVVSQCLVIRLNGFGKTQVGQGVLMGAIHLGVVIEGRKLTQGVVHLLGAAFKQAAAAGAEQGIAAKEGIANQVGDMIQRVPGDLEQSTL